MDVVRMFCLVVLAGCWKGPAPAPPPPPAPDAPPELDMIAIEGETVQFYRLTARGGLDEMRAVDAPAAIDQFRWLGNTLAVLALDDDRRNPQVGTIAQTGFAALAIPPATAWPDTQQPDMDHFDPPNWDLTVTATGELWLGRCEWGYYGEGTNCVEWAWARVQPAPAPGKPFAIARKAPPARTATPYTLPPVAPAAGMRVELVDDAHDGQADGEHVRKILRCTQRGKTVEFPPADDRGDGFLGMSDLVWVATDPPMFRVTRSDACMDTCTTEVTFEGCAVSKRFESASLLLGPGGTYALVTSDFTSVRWRGKELGRIDGPRHDVAFGPR